MSTDAFLRRGAGALGGSLVAGFWITAVLLVMEKTQGEPSELITLERAGARRLGLPAHPDIAMPTATEQAIAQGGHFLLSAACGAAYALAVRDDRPVVRNGVVFGLLYYATLQWIAGPLLGLKKPEWRAGAKTIAMHTGNHVLFGLITALGARLARRR